MLELIKILWEYILKPIVWRFRKIIFFGGGGLILLLWVGTSWGFFRLPFVKINALEAIPENTSLVLETIAYQQVLEELHATPYINDLYHISILKKWEKGILYLDSLMKSTQGFRNLLDKAHIVSGVQLSSKQNADWLYIIEDYGQSFDPKLFLEELMPRRVLTSTYRGKTIYRLEFDEKKEYSLAFFEGLILASPLTLLVEAGIEQLDNIQTNVTQDPTFEKIYEKNNLIEGDLTVYVNLKYLSLLAATVSDNSYHTISKLAKIGSWTGLGTRFLSNGFILSGHLYPNEENKFLKELAKQQAPKDSKIAQYLPKNLAALLYLGWTDFNQLYQVSKTADNPYFEDYVLPYLGRDVALAYKDPIDDKHSFQNDILVFLHCTDTAAARKALNEYGSNYGKTTMKAYQNFDITQLNMGSLLQPIFGSDINPIETPFYTIIDNYFVFANSETALEGWIQQFTTGQTLEKTVEYGSFINQSKNESNIYCLLSTPKAMKFLQYFVREEWHGLLENSFKHFRNIYPIGIQFHAFESHFLMTLSAEYHIVKEQEVNQASIAWTFDLEADLLGEPQVVHLKEQDLYYVIAQDANLRLYCINKNGQNLWPKEFVLPEAINSEIFEIDFHGNGKTDFAFSTEKAIYVFDESGNKVKQIDLVAPAVAGVLAIDYGKGPRFFIACKNGAVYGFDKHGTPLSGWQPHKGIGPVHYPLAFMDYDEKHYLLAVSRAGTTKGFKRSGEAYFRNAPLGGKLQHWDFDASIGRIAGGNSNGKIYIINSAGKNFVINPEKGINKEVKFAYADVVGDGRKDYIRLSGNQVAIHYYAKEEDKKGRKKDNFKTFKLFEVKASNQEIFAVDVRGRQKQLIGALDKRNASVSLYDAEGKLQNGFPLSGTTRFKVVDLFNESGNTLVVGSQSKIYTYKVKL